MVKLYVIRGAGADCRVVHVKTWKAAFYGTRAECREWIERNGHDDSEMYESWMPAALR